MKSPKGAFHQTALGAETTGTMETGGSVDDLAVQRHALALGQDLQHGCRAVAAVVPVEPMDPFRHTAVGHGSPCRPGLKMIRLTSPWYCIRRWGPPPPAPPGALGTCDLIVEATTKPNRGSYTPHLTVKAPSTHGGTDNPVQTVGATLKQTLTIRYYSYK
jgi:hypothetical protein